MWERTLSQKLVRLFCEQKVVDIQMLESEQRGRRREQQSKPSQPSHKQDSI